jgi:hypothetical protein
MGREPILSKICIAANVQENVILHYKTLFRQNDRNLGRTCDGAKHPDTISMSKYHFKSYM